MQNVYSTSCPSIYRGKVINNSDPKKLGRCQIVVPSIHGNITNKEIVPWARPVAPTTINSNRGSINIPDVGDIVWVMFEGANKEYPIYFGGTYSTSDFEVDQNQVILYLEEGNMILYDRSSGTYQLNAGENIIVLSKNRISIIGDVQVSGNMTVSGKVTDLGMVDITESPFDEPKQYSSGSEEAPGGSMDIEDVGATTEAELEEILANINEHPDSFMYHVKLIKSLVASKKVTYNQQAYITVGLLGGRTLKVRTDCSGLVSAMVSSYTGGDILMSSYSYVNAASLEGFTKITSLSDLKAGDICARNGHVEVYAYRDKGVDYVYSGGSTASLQSDTPTKKGSGSYDVVWRPVK